MMSYVHKHTQMRGGRERDGDRQIKREKYKNLLFGDFNTETLGILFWHYCKKINKKKWDPKKSNNKKKTLGEKIA